MKPQLPLRLALLDLDGTLKLERDPFVYLHRHLGTMDAAAEFTARGLRGELGHEEWLRLDAELWVGVPEARIVEAFRASPYLPGAQELIAGLHRAGVEIALISSGLDLHAKIVAQELGIEIAVTNELVCREGRATGEIIVGLPEGRKGLIADRLLAERGLTPKQCLAMGDGSADLELFERAALRVAVAPTSKRLAAAADIVLETPDLHGLLARLRALRPGCLPEA